METGRKGEPVAGGPIRRLSPGKIIASVAYSIINFPMVSGSGTILMNQSVEEEIREETKDRRESLKNKENHLLLCTQKWNQSFLLANYA